MLGAITALHHAARNGDLEIVGQLVSCGADPNAMSDHGHFPLYCAAGHGHLETTRYLVDNGADLDARLSDGKTVVEWLKQFADHDRRFRLVWIYWRDDSRRIAQLCLVAILLVGFPSGKKLSCHRQHSTQWLNVQTRLLQRLPHYCARCGAQRHVPRGRNDSQMERLPRRTREIARGG